MRERHLKRREAELERKFLKELPEEERHLYVKSGTGSVRWDSGFQTMQRLQRPEVIKPIRNTQTKNQDV